MKISASIILSLINIAVSLAETIGELIAIAKQRGELTPEQEADFDARMAAAFEAPRWKSRRK